MITAFSTPEERRDFDNLFSKKINNYHSKSGQCRWPGCTEKPIGSHSISKRISLMPISEDGHMIGKKSKREGESKKVSLSQIGINEGLVFRGFCAEHDSEFNAIDVRGIKTENDLLKQAFRSLHFINFQNDVFKVYYPEFAKKTLSEPIISQLYKNMLCENPDNKISFNNFKIAVKKDLQDSEDQQKVRIQRVDNILSDLHYLFQSKNTGHIIPACYCNNLLKDNCIYCRTLPFCIPVAINAKFTFPNVHRNEADLYVVSIPYENSTMLIFLYDKALHPKMCELYKLFDTHEVYMLSFIENTLVCSDDWLIKPSIITSLNEERYDVFLKDCYYISEFNPFAFYDISIFDEIRIRIIDTLGAEIKRNELSKTTNIPVRPSDIERMRRQYKKQQMSL